MYIICFIYFPWLQYKVVNLFKIWYSILIKDSSETIYLFLLNSFQIASTPLYAWPKCEQVNYFLRWLH